MFIFRYITEVSDIYEFMIGQLGKNLYDCDINIHNRLVEAYHSSIRKRTQQRITEAFERTDAKLRVLISTVGFGMGVNVPEVEHVIHWGVSTNALFYWQEAGCAGRDGCAARATLYATARSLSDKKTGADMREILNKAKSGECFRTCILRAFITPTDGSTASTSSSSASPPSTCACKRCRCCTNRCQMCPMYKTTTV